MENTLSLILEKLNKLDDRFYKIENRLDKIEIKLDKMDDRLDHIEITIAEVLNNVKYINNKMYDLQLDEEIIHNTARKVAKLERTAIKG